MEEKAIPFPVATGHLCGILTLPWAAGVLKEGVVDTDWASSRTDGDTPGAFHPSGERGEGRLQLP